MEFMLSEEQRMLKDSVGGYLESACPLDRVRQVADAEETTAQDVRSGLAELGIPGILIPEEYGGQGWDNVSFAVAMEEFGAVDSSVRGFLTVHSGLVSRCILDHGTEEQKRRTLPRLASGEWLGGYCMT